MSTTIINKLNKKNKTLTFGLKFLMITKNVINLCGKIKAC